MLSVVPEGALVESGSSSREGMWSLVVWNEDKDVILSDLLLLDTILGENTPSGTVLLLQHRGEISILCPSVSWKPLLGFLNDRDTDTVLSRA